MNDIKKKQAEERAERLAGNKETLFKFTKRLERDSIKHSENRRDLLVKAMLRKINDGNDDITSALRGLDLVLKDEADEIKELATKHSKAFAELSDALRRKVKTR